LAIWNSDGNLVLSCPQKTAVKRYREAFFPNGAKLDRSSSRPSSISLSTNLISSLGFYRVNVAKMNLITRDQLKEKIDRGEDFRLVNCLEESN
jgi:hypothetical protein